MNHQKLEKAIEMAKNDAKILANPSSKLYPILIRKLKLVANPAESVEEVKENISLNELKSAPVAKPKVAKNNLTLSKPLQPKPIMANSKKIAKVVDNIVKPTAAVLYSPRQSSMSKSRKIIISLVAAKKKPQPPMLQPHQPKRSLNPPISNSVFNDFVVPKLDSPNPTRTGLVQKSKKSDLESMRQESDDRLKIAMKHLIIARKKALAEEKLKRAKLNKYSKVKSKVGSTQWTPNKDMKAKEEGLTLKTMSKNMNSPSNRRELPQRWDLGQEFLESSTNVNAGGNIQDISMIQHVYDEKSPLGQTDNGKINLEIPAKISSKGGISAHQVTPNAENNHLPMNNFVSQSSPIPVKAAFKPKSSTNVNAEIIMPLSKNLTKAASSSNLVTPKSNSKPLKATSTSNSTPTLNSKIKLGNAKSTADTDRIIQKVLQALETKLDPMLAKVQQHWENAAANIDEKIAHALERHEEVVQEPLLVDMEEPSILVESETQYFQVTNAKAISPKQFQQDGGGHDEDDAILIQNEIKYVEKAPKIPYQRTVLALPAYMIEDIIQDQSRKQKWREMYYGADFDSASAIERVGKELVNEMIDTVINEIGSVSNEYLEALLKSEIF